MPKWNRIADEHPPKDNLKFYGDRYSVPVMVASDEKVNVAPELFAWVSFTAARFDFHDHGWVDKEMTFGPDPEDYDGEYEGITHWMLWPEFRPDDKPGRADAAWGNGCHCPMSDHCHFRSEEGRCCFSKENERAIYNTEKGI